MHKGALKTLVLFFKKSNQTKVVNGNAESISRVEDFTLKHLLLSEKCARDTCEKFVYKHLETIEYVKN